MRTSFNAWKILAIGAALATIPLSALAVDSISIEAGSSNHVNLARVAAQWDWSQRWFSSNGNHISGYWDLSLSQWRGNKYQNISGQHQNITDFGFTPVFRWQQDNKKGLYAEAGIGVHVLSHLYNNADKRLSTAFQFGDHVGIGYVFSNNLDLSLRFEHFSNAGIKQPNTGVNFGVVRASYRF